MRSFLLYVAILSGGLVVGLAGGWFAGQASSASPPMSAGDPATSLANGPAPCAVGITQVNELTLRGDRDLYNGYPARNADGTINVVVEIPTGTNAKWEVNAGGQMTLEVRDGSPRVVKYLPYPGNYGMIPGTKLPKEQGGDGDAIDVLILGPTLPRGTVARARLIGMMKFLDKGEQDDKLLAVMDHTPLSKVRSLKELNAAFPKVSEIVLTWFENYKSPGIMVFKGWGEAPEALALVDRGIAAAR